LLEASRRRGEADLHANRAPEEGASRLSGHCSDIPLSGAALAVDIIQNDDGRALPNC